MTAPRRRPPSGWALALVLASRTPLGVGSVDAFASSAALKTAVDNCLDATPDGTGASCCSSAGADCGVAGSTDMPDWNVTGVTDLSELFLDRVAFDQNISAWDVSAVTDMRATFRNASSFDADISAWDVSSVTSTRETFRDASAFTADVRAWPTVSVLDRHHMFLGAVAWLAAYDTPPSFVSYLGVAYPHIPASLVRETHATLRVRVDADATVYFLAVPVGVDFGVVDPATGAVRTVPTPAEVREGTDGPVGTFGRGGLVSGAFNVTAGVTTSANVTNLTEASSNDLWVVAATRNGTLQSHVSLLDARTRDMTPPGFLPVDDGGASAPRLFVGARSVDVASRLTETGAAFLVVQSPETQAPTAAQIRARALAGDAGTCAVNATVAGDIYGCGVFDLLEATNHSAFYTVEDAPEVGSPNLLETAFRFDFQTRDATPPIGALTLGDVREDGFDVHAKSTKNGTVFWVVVPAGAPAPTFEEVSVGVASGGAAPVASGRFVVAGAAANRLGAASRALAVGSADGTVAVVGARPETAYDAHAVFADDQNANDPGENFNATVVSLLGVVTLDVDPPTVAAAVENVTSAGFTLALTVDEPARVHYVVVPRWRPAPTPLADAPTPEEIAAGTGRRRSAAAACGFVDVSPADVLEEVRVVVAAVADPAANDACVNGGFYDAAADAWTAGAPVVGGNYTATDARDAAAAAASGAFDAAAAASSPRYGGEDGDGVAVPSLPTDPTVLLCAVCPWFSPEGAYDVWVVAEDDGNDPAGTNASAGGNGTATGGTNRGVVATRAKTVGVEDPRAPSFVAADARAPSTAANLTAENASFATLRVSLDEAGAAAFALRPGGVAAANLTREEIAALAGWDPTAASASLAEAPPLAPGARAGILRIDRTPSNATGFDPAFGSFGVGFDASHVVSLPPPDARATGARGRGETHVVDLFAVDLEPTRGSNATTRSGANVGAVVSAWATAEDALAPLWVGDGPSAKGVAVGAADAAGAGAARANLLVAAETDEPATVFYVVARVVEGFVEPTPSAADVVRAGGGDPSIVVAFGGALFSSAASDRVSGNFTCDGDGAGGCSHARSDTPLAQGVAYVAWFVAVDASPAKNARGSPTRVAFIAEDAVPPSLATLPSSPPTVSDVAPDGSFNLRVALASPGRVFWVVTAGGASATAPTRAEIVAGRGAGGAAPLDDGVAVAAPDASSAAVFVASAAATAGDISALPSDGFSVHVALAAAAPVNASVFSGDGAANPADVDASSGRRAAPSLARDEDEPDESVGFATLEETTLTPRVAVTSAPATVAYVVLRRGSRAPTPAQILAGVDANGRAPLDPAGSDFAETASASTAHAAEATAAFVGTAIGGGVVNLTRGTWYDVHVVVADVGATNAPASFFRRVRARDDTEPFFLPGYPRETATTPTATRVETRLDEPAAVWAVAVPAGTLAAPPSVADVAAVAANRWNASTGTIPREAEANETASSAALSSVVVSVAVAVADERVGVGDDPRVRPLELILSGLNPGTKYEVYAAAREYHRGVNGDAPATTGAAQSAAAKTTATTPASVARLSALVATVGTFVPEFDPETTEYALKIPHPPGVAMPWPKTTLAAVAGDGRWSVEANGAPLASGATTDAYAPGDVVSLRVAPRESHVAGLDSPTESTTYRVRVSRISSAVGTPAEDATLALLHVATDDGASENATRMGGVGWPECALACVPVGTHACLSARKRCAMDPDRRAYRSTVSTGATIATVTAVTSAPNATAKIRVGGDDDAGEGRVMRAAAAKTAKRAGAEGAVPEAVSADVDLSRAFARAEGGKVFVFVRVASPDGTREETYAVEMTRDGPGEANGAERRGTATETPPTHATTPKLTFYP